MSNVENTYYCMRRISKLQSGLEVLKRLLGNP